jgi:hypothetical protein
MGLFICLIACTGKSYAEMRRCLAILVQWGKKQGTSLKVCLDIDSTPRQRATSRRRRGSHNEMLVGSDCCQLLAADLTKNVLYL